MEGRRSAGEQGSALRLSGTVCRHSGYKDPVSCLSYDRRDSPRVVTRFVPGGLWHVSLIVAGASGLHSSPHPVISTIPSYDVGVHGNGHAHRIDFAGAEGGCMRLCIPIGDSGDLGLNRECWDGWGKRRRMCDGERWLPYDHRLEWRRGET